MSVLLAIATATSQVGVALGGPDGPIASLHVRQGRRQAIDFARGRMMLPFGNPARIPMGCTDLGNGPPRPYPNRHGPARPDHQFKHLCRDGWPGQARP